MSDVRFSIVRSIITVALPVAVGLLSVGVGEQGEKEVVSAGKVAVGVEVEEPRGSLLELGDFVVGQKSAPASSFGRSSGVALWFSQTPCKSGLPSGVSGGVHLVGLARDGDGEEHDRQRDDCGENVLLGTSHFAFTDGRAEALRYRNVVSLP